MPEFANELVQTLEDWSISSYVDVPEELEFPKLIKWLRTNKITDAGQALAQAPRGDWWLTIASVCNRQIDRKLMPQFLVECADRVVAAFAEEAPDDSRVTYALSVAHAQLLTPQSLERNIAFITAQPISDPAGKAADEMFKAGKSKAGYAALVVMGATLCAWLDHSFGYGNNSAVHHADLSDAIEAVKASDNQKIEQTWQADRLRELFG
jgi:hypothetical protein